MADPVDSCSTVADLERRNRELLVQLRALEQRTRADVAAHDAHLKECRAREAEYQRLGLAHDATQRRAYDQRAKAAAEARDARRERERLSDELREEKRHAADLGSQHAWVTRRFEELKARYDSERGGRWVRTAQALEEREREVATVRASLTRLQRQADDCARRHQHEAAELKRLLDQHHQRAEARLERVQSALQRRLEQANEMLQYERNARDALQTEKDATDSELRRTYAQASNDRVKLERDLREAKDHANRLLDAQARLASEVHKLGVVAARVTELEQEHASAQRNLNKLQSELKFIKEQYERAENDRKEEREDRRRLEEELRVVRGQLSVLHTRSGSEREEHDASRVGAVMDEDYLRRVLSEKESLEVRLGHATVKEESTSARIEELTREQEILERECGKAHRERDRLQREFKECERQAEVEKQRRVNLELDVKRLEHDLDDARRKAIESQNRGSSHANIDADSQRKVLELEKQFKNERRQKEEKDREVRRLKELLVELESQQEKHKNEELAASVRAKNVARELEEMRALTEKLRREADAERTGRQQAEEHGRKADNLAKEWERKFKTEISSASGATDALKTQVTQLTEQLKKECDRAREADVRAKGLDSELVALIEDLEDAKLINTKLEKEKKLLQVENEKLEEDLQALEGRLKNATSKTATSEDIAKQYEAQIKMQAAKFEKERANLLRDSATLEAQVTQLRETARNAERARDNDIQADSAVKIDALNSRIATLEKEKATLQNAKKALEEDAASLTTKLKQLEDRLVAEIANTSHAGDIGKKSEAATVTVQAREKELQQEIDAQKTKLKAEEDKNAKARSELQREVETLKLKSVEAEKIKDEILRAEAEKQQLQEQIETLKKSAAVQTNNSPAPEFTDEKVKLEAENAHLTAEVEELKAKLEAQRSTSEGQPRRTYTEGAGSVIGAALESQQSTAPKLSHPTANRAVPKRAHKTQNAAKLLEEKRDKELSETLNKDQPHEETDEELEERERKEKAERVKRMAASSGMGGMGMMAMGNIAAAAAQRGRGGKAGGRGSNPRGRGK